MRFLYGLAIAAGLLGAALPARAGEIDRLLDLLTQKGTITRQEADALRKQVAADQAAAVARVKDTPVTARSKTRFSGYAQTRLQLGNGIKDTEDVRRVRLVFSGSVAPGWDYRINSDVGGAGRRVIDQLGANGAAPRTTTAQKPFLLDATLAHPLSPAALLTIGQFKVPFGQENLISSSELETINRSQVTELLVPGRDIGSQGRDIGLTVTGGSKETRGLRRVEYAVGLFNGAGTNASDVNDQKDAAVRLVFHPSAPLSLGVSSYRGRFGAQATDRDRWGLELAWVQKRYLVKAEYVDGQDDQTDKNGWYLLAGYTAHPRLQLVAKLDAFEPNENVRNDRTRVGTLGANWFLNPVVKLQINYEKRDEQGTEISNDLLLSQIQVKY